jgi:hypothetical protein
MRRSLAILAIAASAACLAPTVASALTIRPDHFSLTKLGGFHPRQDPTLGRAIRVFGHPTARRPRSGCRVRWRELRLHILFENFAGRNACSRHGGLAQKVRIGHSRRWQTNRHLRVGHRVSRLHRLYPNATHHGSRWWLKTALSPISGHHYPVLAARTHDGRVSGFAGWIGAAGE